MILGRFSQQENKVNFKEGIVRGTNDVIPPGKDRKDTRKKQKDSNSSSNSSTVGLAQSPKLKLWNELAELSDEGSSSEEDNFGLDSENIIIIFFFVFEGHTFTRIYRDFLVLSPLLRVFVVFSGTSVGFVPFLFL